jgi:hypothetical protein
LIAQEADCERVDVAGKSPQAVDNEELMPKEMDVAVKAVPISSSKVDLSLNNRVQRHHQQYQPDTPLLIRKIEQ